MEIKELVSLAAPTVLALVGLLTYRHNVRTRKEDSRPQRARPVMDLTHTVTHSNIAQDTHVLRLDISHREDKPIAIKEVCWYVKSFRTRWPLSYSCALLPDSSRLQEWKIEAADLLQLEIEIQDVFRPLLGSRVLPLVDTIVAVATLDVCVV